MTEEITKVSFNQNTNQSPPQKEVKMPTQTTSSKPKTKINPVIAVLLFLIVAGAGIGTGYSLSQLKPLPVNSTSNISAQVPDNPDQVKVGDVFGSKNTDAFKDNTEGVLVKGGVEGEGSHHLLKPGGKSQNVYLTSSVVDLDKFLNHKIKVYGETFKAQKAGWLMDAGRVEILELNAEKPFDETQ